MLTNISRTIATRSIASRSLVAPMARSSLLLSSPNNQIRYMSDAGKSSTKLWGGRFTKDVDKNVKTWTDAIPIDKNLAVEDMWGSIAHVTMLGRQGIIPAENAAAIVGVLADLQQKFIDGSWKLGQLQDDVHMDVEATVIKHLGMDVGGRMHATRSRNDQVVLDSKMYCRRRLLELRSKAILAAQAFLERSKNHLEDVMVSYTHVQHAQPISVAYWLSHYASIVLRDLTRLKNAYDVSDENPLGSGAIAGTSFPIDRHLTTRLLGFQKVHDHGLDATSARDFMLDGLTAAATLNTTWSRLAEELILWSSWEFRSVTLDDGFAMGSSMMPQKKNPGPLELLRGRAGRVNGLVSAGYTMMKGLPSGYNRDFHEDKEIMVELFNIVNDGTEIIPALVHSTTLNLARMAELPAANFANATELANFLVSKHQVPFRQAHHIVGSLVGELSRSGRNFTDEAACMKHLEKHNIKCTAAELHSVLDGKSVMMSYNSYGGTGPHAVKQMIESYESRLKTLTQEYNTDRQRIDKAYDACRMLAVDAGKKRWQTPQCVQKSLDQFAKHL